MQPKPIVSKKDGKVHSYQLRVFRGRDMNGKRLKDYSTTWKIPEGMTNPRTIKKELEKAAALFEVQCKTGLVSSENKSFQQYAKYVLELKARDNKHSTVKFYEQLLPRVNDEIGGMKLKDITSEHLNRFYLKLGKPGQNKRTGGGLSAKSIMQYHRLIHIVLEQAKKEGFMYTNVAEQATPPAVKRKEVSIFEEEQIAAIRECLKKEPLKWQCITQLMIASGARRGEIMGLKWSAINFKNDTIEIRNNLMYSKDIGIYDETPKNGKFRTISIYHPVMQLLATQKKEQAIARLKMGELWEDHGYCFTQNDGKPMHPDSITSWLAKFSKNNGLPHIHPHKFRHTNISFLIANGVDVVTVAKRAGHQQVSTTEDIYAHPLAKADAEASRVIGAALYKDHTKEEKKA